MKKLLAILIVIALSICTQSQTSQQKGFGGKNIVNESGCINGSLLSQVVYQTPAGTLNDNEKNGILYMREIKNLQEMCI